MAKPVMLREEDVHGQVLDHLGLVSSVISRLNLIEKVDARIKVSKDNGAKVTMGQRVAAMILNGLGFTDDRLYLFPQFLENKPIGRLLGEGLYLPMISMMMPWDVAWMPSVTMVLPHFFQRSR